MLRYGLVQLYKLFPKKVRHMCRTSDAEPIAGHATQNEEEEGDN